MLNDDDIAYFCQHILDFGFDTYNGLDDPDLHYHRLFDD